eukprot:3160016-Rhodomonas_salina.5
MSNMLSREFGSEGEGFGRSNMPSRELCSDKERVCAKLLAGRFRRERDAGPTKALVHEENKETEKDDEKYGKDKNTAQQNNTPVLRSAPVILLWLCDRGWDEFL